jgi:anti-sigma B factor antagonist
VAALLEERAQVSVLEVEGTLRAPIEVELHQKVETLLSRGQKRILLNLATLSDIDAAGIGELVRAYTTTVASGGALSVAHATRRVSRLLEVTGVLTLLTAPVDSSRSLP